MSRGRGHKGSRKMSQADSSTSKTALAEEEEENAKWTAASVERHLLGFEESYATPETWKEPSLWMHRCSNKETQAHSLGTP